METKSDRVRSLLKNGELKAALKIAKDFQLGITKEQSDILKRGYESMVHPQFYRSIGMDVSENVRKGLETLQLLYGR